LQRKRQTVTKVLSKALGTLASYYAKKIEKISNSGRHKGYADGITVIAVICAYTDLLNVFVTF